MRATQHRHPFFCRSPQRRSQQVECRAVLGNETYPSSWQAWRIPMCRLGVPPARTVGDDGLVARPFLPGIFPAPVIRSLGRSVTQNPAILIGDPEMAAVACYIRVSEFGKNQAVQRRDINDWLKANRIKSASVRWYIDKSKTLDQPDFARLQANISNGEVGTVVIWHLDRLAPSVRDGLQTLCDWCDKSLRIVSVSQEIDVRGAAAKRIGSVLNAVAEMARETRRERTKAGLATARACGRAGGRPKVAADDAKVRMAKKLQKDSTLSINDICKRLEISRSTYCRYVAL